MIPNKTILLIEDNANDAELLELQATKLGYEMVTVESVEQARAWLAQQQFALIILDLTLGNDGPPETLAHVPELKKHCPVYVLTGAANQEANARALGVADFLVKTISQSLVELLLAKCSLHLERISELANAEKLKS